MRRRPPISPSKNWDAVQTAVNPYSWTDNVLLLWRGYNFLDIFQRDIPRFLNLTGFMQPSVERIRLFSRSSSSRRFSSGVRALAARVVPCSLQSLTRWWRADDPRPYSRMVPDAGLPALCGSTIWRLNSSLKRQGRFLSGMAAPPPRMEKTPS